jgi:polyphosphate kinase 2 (PPK2 family)
MIWRTRYQSIVDMENHLHRNGTRIAKFFLHISKDEQRKRLLERIDEPEKNWKVNIADIREREMWGSYMDAYERCLTATSTHLSPWYIVPADDKRNARLIIAQIVADTLGSIPMAYPQPDEKQQAEMKEIRRLLEE